MSLTPTPDLGSPRRLVGVALVVTAAVCVMLACTHGQIAKTLGDTDDAMRLVRVRDLMAGQGWFDQRMLRLQPPLGSVMHWSRLLDGALAAMDGLLSHLTSSATAEWATRFIWPLLWIGPAVVCALSIARRLGGASAVLIGAVLLLLDVQLYSQFRPGRIDHHNIQIVMTLIAAACGVAGDGRRRWGAIAGGAAGLGLAIGVEALAFHALIGAGYALRAGMDARQARVARAYGLALAVSGLAFFLIQTPPSLWSTPVCDALGWNLVAAMVVGGLGLASVAWWGAGASAPARLGLLAAVGLAAAGVYLAADPACLHGPMAAVDPRLRPIWLDRIQELRGWPALWRLDRRAAVLSMTMVAMGLVSAGFLLALARRALDPAAVLAAALVALAGLAAAQALRLDDYVFWFGVPVVAAALARLVERWLHGALVGALAASVVLSPTLVTLAASQAAQAATPPAKAAPRVAAPASLADDPCLAVRAYAPLAALPSGLVLAPIDLGPFILAHTGDSVLSAPYHRMTWGILAAHDALNAPAMAAEAKVRALNVRYIVDCPTDVSAPPPGSLTGDLRRGRTPAWLRGLSGAGQSLKIYRVEPFAAPRG